MPTQDELARLYDGTIGYKAELPLQTPGMMGELEGAKTIHITELIRITSGLVWASDNIGPYGSCFCFLNGTAYMIHPNPHFALPVRSSK
jgi:hypothetical protein